MARTRQKHENPALTAAAFTLEEKGQGSLLYNSRVIDYLLNSSDAGQTAAAWFFYFTIPELRYISRYISNALSVATLYIGDTSSMDGGAPKRLPDSHPASELLRSFAGGPPGQSELLDRISTHLTVAGESILIGPKQGPGSLPEPFDQWRVYSSSEIYSRNGKTYMKLPGESRETPVPSGALSVRIWRQGARYWWETDSPVKGSFRVLEELDLLDKHVRATATSRLSGAGMLGIPDEFDLPQAEMEVEGTEVDQFIAFLVEVMGTAIQNPGKAASLVPIIMRGPAEFLDKIRHFDFATEFSNMVPDLRTGAIRRLALGMDVPPEVLLGNSDSASWSAWQTDESTLRVHLVPMLQLIASSLTVGWLRPMLAEIPGISEEEIQNLCIHFDVSNLKIRQDISGDSQALYDRGELNGKSLRKAAGYNEDAAPNNKELARQILLHHVYGTQPELVYWAAKGLSENFGIKLLPDGAPAEQPSASPGRPGEGIQPETATPSGPTPGERSQNKQVSPPPVPKIGDQSNNEVK